MVLSKNVIMLNHAVNKLPFGIKIKQLTHKQQYGKP